jgi:hypothetical protein
MQSQILYSGVFDFEIRKQTVNILNRSSFCHSEAESNKDWHFRMVKRYCTLDEQFMSIMCYIAYLQQGLAFAVVFVQRHSVLEGGRPHAKVRLGQAAGGAELSGSSTMTLTAIGDDGGGDKQQWLCDYCRELAASTSSRCCRGSVDVVGSRQRWSATPLGPDSGEVVELRCASPGLLLRHGLLDAGVDPDLCNLNGGRRWWHSSGGSNRGWPGGDTALAFIFELAWRICIEERECEFWYCLSPQLQICIAFCNACWSPNQLCTVPNERHFCLYLVLLDSA